MCNYNFDTILDWCDKNGHIDWLFETVCMPYLLSTFFDLDGNIIGCEPIYRNYSKIEEAFILTYHPTNLKKLPSSHSSKSMKTRVANAYNALYGQKTP